MQVRRSLEEKLNGDLENMRDLLQAARPDPIGALLVFLDLLTCEVERIAELFLAHCKHHPAHAHAAPHVLVDRVGGFFCGHNDTLLRSRDSRSVFMLRNQNAIDFREPYCSTPINYDVFPGFPRLRIGYNLTGGKAFAGDFIRCSAMLWKQAT